MFGQRSHTWVGKHHGAFAAVLEFAEQGQDCGGIGLFAFGRDLRQNFLNCADLFRFIVNNKISLITKLFDVLAKNANTKGMESANGGTRIWSFATFAFGSWSLDAN